MDPTLLAGLVSGGSNIVDAGMQAITNSKNQKFALKMYNRQRADALSDWNMQNAYNAPSAQMDRLKAAKLNPNLVYGTGVQASGLSGSVRSSSASVPERKAPSIDMGSAFSAIYDTKLKQTQIDTMKSVQDLNKSRKAQVDADTIVKGAQKGYLDIGTATKAFKLGLDKSLVGVTVDTASANLDKIRAQKDQIVTQTFMTMHEDIRRELLTSATFQEKMQHVALMVAQEAAQRQGIKLSQAQVDKINAEVDVLGTTQLGKDLQNRLSKRIVDNFTMDQVRKWVASVTSLGQLVK